MASIPLPSAPKPPRLPWQWNSGSPTTPPASRDPFTLPGSSTASPFQISVWNALEALGYDEVISYAELARRVGSNGYRAVGTAVGHNPIPIIIPCHRIGAGRTASSAIRRRGRH